MPWDEIEVDLSSVKHVVEPSGPSGGLGVVVMTLMDRGSVLDRFTYVLEWFGTEVGTSRGARTRF